MKIIATIVVLCLFACGSKREKEHGETGEHADEHGHDGSGHAGAADDQHIAIDPEMLRDLRITTAKAEARAAGERVTVLGELGVNEDAYAEIAAPVTARVVKVLAGVGDTVKANQTLVELNSPDLGKARAELDAAKTRAEVAQAALARKRDLAADKLVTARELQNAEADAKNAEADVRIATAALKSFGDTGGGSSRFALKTPIDGTVIDRTVAMGQLADPSRTLFRVGDLSHLWLTAHVFERDAMRVKAGGTATVTLAAMPGQPVEASVVLIGREVEAASRTVSVRIDVPNPDGSLRPGMSATVALPLGDAAASVVTVPLSAVQRVGENWVVFLPQAEGVFEIRPIGRGRELGGDVEVLSGLTADTAVVVDGAFLLKAEADKARGEGGEHED